MLRLALRTRKERLCVHVSIDTFDQLKAHNAIVGGLLGSNRCFAQCAITAVHVGCLTWVEDLVDTGRKISKTIVGTRYWN